MKNWLTTLFGVLAGVATVAAHGIKDIPSLIAAAAMAFLGTTAKDASNTK